jgi:hypothetical protein
MYTFIQYTYINPTNTMESVPRDARRTVLGLVVVNKLKHYIYIDMYLYMYILIYIYIHS